LNKHIQLHIKKSLYPRYFFLKLFSSLFYSLYIPYTISPLSSDPMRNFKVISNPKGASNPMMTPERKPKPLERSSSLMEITINPNTANSLASQTNPTRKVYTVSRAPSSATQTALTRIEERTCWASLFCFDPSMSTPESKSAADLDPRTVLYRVVGKSPKSILSKCPRPFFVIDWVEARKQCNGIVRHYSLCWFCTIVTSITVLCMITPNQLNSN
jgi:hypothetical protein